jgi:glycosyltransferase involved in cell wall biosynthesis
MRILQLTPRIAWPPTDGGRVVMLQIARALHAQGAAVEVLSLNPRKQRVSVDDARRALAPVPLDAVDIDTSAHVAALARAFRLRVPQLVARFYSPAFDAAIRARLAERVFDVVQVESPFLLPYVRAIRATSNAAIVLRSLNVEFRIWERLAANEPNVLRRIALAGIARSLRRYELAQLHAVDALVPITAVDAEDYRGFGCTLPMHVLPGGVDVDDRVIDRTAEGAEAVGFLGSLDYRPNQEAALWIAEELQPRLAGKARLHIAGSRAPEWLRTRLQASGVTFAGEVPDASAYLRGMRVVIAPILSGGGMRIKILEAMAAGKAVVSTTIGAEGIDAIPNEHLVIADDADTFAAAIAELLRDPSRTRALGDAARLFVRSRYATGVLARGLVTFYEELTQGRDVRGRR